MRDMSLAGPRRSLLLLGLWIVSILFGASPCLAQARETRDREQLIGELEYVIGPEDVLDIAVWNNKEMSRTVPVRPDGRISLPLVNDLQAAGLTPTQLKDAISKAVAPYIPTAELSVIVREVHSFKVAVIGEVKTPGRYELGSVATVLDVLAMAGGLTEYAARDRVVIFRREGTTTRQIPFDYTRLTSRGDSTKGVQDNFCVQAGDIILVP
jgi:polysaccharide export outer membrane protein